MEEYRFRIGQTVELPCGLYVKILERDITDGNIRYLVKEQDNVKVWWDEGLLKDTKVITIGDRVSVYSDAVIGNISHIYLNEHG